MKIFKLISKAINYTLIGMIKFYRKYLSPMKRTCHCRYIPTCSQYAVEALQKYGLLVNEVPTRYHSPYFAHIWGGGYSAGYYAYTWSKTLDYNAYDWFEANGGMTRKNCDRFVKYILSVGNSVDLNKAFKEFIGHDMKIEPYLKNAGLTK
jgi:Zn-dependent oligopeptidase